MTRLHSERVADIARDLARKVKDGNEAYAQAIYRAARLHDIGKIAIPEAVLLKPGSLTPRSSPSSKATPPRGPSSSLRRGRWPLTSSSTTSSCTTTSAGTGGATPSGSPGTRSPRRPASWAWRTLTRP